MFAWEELVVFEKPVEEEVRENVVLHSHDCEAIQLVLTANANLCEIISTPKIPTPSEFVEVLAPLILERTYEEVSPFPKISRVKIGARIIQGDKIFQWRRLRAGEKADRFFKLKPFKAERHLNGVVVTFVDPRASLKTRNVPYCRRDCKTAFGNQCAKFGSYSQIELSPFLPYWPDRCSAESAETCPMRLATTTPKPDPNDPVIKAFQEWCKTRKGYAGEKPRCSV